MEDPQGGASAEERGIKQVEIEKPEISDVPRILELLTGQDAFHNGLDAGYYVEPNNEERVNQFKDDVEKSITSEDPSKEMRVAKVDRKIVGFITYGIGEEVYLDTQQRKFVEIKELFVEEEARKHGAGRKLRSEALNLARENGVGIKVQYSVHNEGAKRFWSEVATPSQEIAYSQPES